VNIINRIEIAATPEKIFYWLEEPERGKQWMTSVTRGEILQKTPNKVGTTFREYIEEDGRGIEMEGVITEFVSNEKFAVHLESKLNTLDVCFILEGKGPLTQLTQNFDLRFKGKMKVLSMFMRLSIKKKIKSQAQREFARLKELCEQDDYYLDVSLTNE